MANRRTHEELRERMLGAGLRVLDRRGLRATAGHVPMSEAMAERREGPPDRPLGASGPRSCLRRANDASVELIGSLDDDRPEPYERRMEVLVDLCRAVGDLGRGSLLGVGFVALTKEFFEDDID